MFKKTDAILVKKNPKYYLRSLEKILYDENRLYCL